ncbi:alpha/beta fold hydrolase [Streptomyces canus]|uniref:alpha/beta fold hydrolase n=1 Tax=Streptomyces canus TaxID=58343 RepID=UPI003CEB7791
MNPHTLVSRAPGEVREEVGHACVRRPGQRARSGPAGRDRGTSTHTWKPLLADLAAEHTLALADLPGSGRSPLPGGPLEAGAAADQVVAAARKAGLTEFRIAGTSLGAAVAVAVAARHASEQGVQHVVGDDRWPAAVLALAGCRVEPFEGRLANVLSPGLRRRREEGETAVGRGRWGRTSGAAVRRASPG